MVNYQRRQDVFFFPTHHNYVNIFAQMHHKRHNDPQTQEERGQCRCHWILKHSSTQSNKHRAVLQKFRCETKATFQHLIETICRSQVCKALRSLFCSLTHHDASVFPFQKTPPGDIFIFLSLSLSSSRSLSGPRVAVGRCRTKDKSALFSLTGNSRAEQHLSPLIHYPTLHLASPGHHTSSLWDLSPLLITHQKASGTDSQ